MNVIDFSREPLKTLNIILNSPEVSTIGGLKIISPTMFSGKVEIPDLRNCFPRDTVKTVKTVKMVMLRFLPNLPIGCRRCRGCCQ